MSGYAVNTQGGWRAVDSTSDLLSGESFQTDQPPYIDPTAEDILAANKAMRDNLLTSASLAIGPLSDAVDLGVATDNDTANLKAWRTYRVAVNRTDLTPVDVVWPDVPSLLS